MGWAAASKIQAAPTRNASEGEGRGVGLIPAIGCALALMAAASTCPICR